MNIVLTGDRPTGPLHLGHYVGSLTNRLQLQEKHQQYIMIADVQALTDNFSQPQKIHTNVYEVMKDYLSVGLNADKSIIFLQSQIPEIAELTVYYLNLVNLGRLERNPTVKLEIQQKNFKDSLPVGFLCYPISQAADISIFKADLVPVGDDQLPMLEQTNEIVRKFNNVYQTDCLNECKPYLSNASRLVGIDGKNKASKSLNNAIFLSDDSKTVKNKVFKMFTDPNHLNINDPGKVEGNVVFTYLDAFHKDQAEVDNLKEDYQRGGLGDVTIKNILYKTLEELLLPIRDRRQQIKQVDVKEILFASTSKARKTAIATMEQIRSLMQLNYFS